MVPRPDEPVPVSDAGVWEPGTLWTWPPRSPDLLPATTVTLPLPTSTLKETARGFTCLTNVYIHKGVMKVNAGKGPGSFKTGSSLRDYLTLDGPESGVKELSTVDLAELNAHPPPTISSAIIHNEWPIVRRPESKDDEDVYLSHFGHYVEAVASSLVLEAVDDLPLPEAVFCCRCGPSFNGERGLNMFVTAALYNGAPLIRCKEVNGAAGVADPPLPFPAATLSAPLRPPPAALRPWALHIGRACMVDRHIAHRAKETSVANNINALLVPIATSEVQEKMDIALQRLRTSPMLDVESIFPPGYEDFFGKDIAATLAEERPRSDPILTIVYRKPPQRRSIDIRSFTAFAAALEELCPSMIVVQAEKLNAAQQIKLFSSSDILLGTQGNGMAHLLWTPLGSSVFEIFPHFRHVESPTEIQEGTGWTNDWPFLTRLKGNSYRAVDSKLGSRSPMKMSISDLSHQLHVGDLVLNQEALLEEFQGLLETWREVREAMDKGEKVNMREKWHPLYVDEKPWAP